MDYKGRINRKIRENPDLIQEVFNEEGFESADQIADGILRACLTPSEYGEMFVEDSEAICEWLKERYELYKYEDEEG